MTERTREQLRRHYEVERELADRLRAAPAEERKRLYSSVYDELFRRVPDHPQLTWKADAAERAQTVEAQLAVLDRFLSPDTAFLEIGAGDCALSLAASERVRRVYALDVSAEITRDLETPENFELILSDGTSVPVAEGSVEVAYSNQLMEHLHPDDAKQQLLEIRRALAPGGVYVCITPNRLLGPADISKHFDPVATGFHLKEYTNGELASLCREVGFRRVQALVWLKWFGIRVPSFVPAAAERLAERLPRNARRPFGRLLGVNLIAWR
jgi:SAM-dependent methyltransferase